MLRLASALLLSAALVACTEGQPPRPPGGSADAGPPDAAAPDGGAPEAVLITPLGEVTDDAGIRSQRFRIQRGQGAASYGQWYPPAADGGTAPVVILAQPYDGIDWTGEAVDARWAARGPGAFPDEDGPNFDPATSADIGYAPITNDQSGDATFLWRYHGFGVLLMFGRFYAGGDVQNDIDDMTLGFELLAEQPEVDRSRIGILGGSWGGFEALYGAAYAREDLRPAVGVALYPVSDFELERRYATEVLPNRYTEANSRAAAATFFEPYVRRIDATVIRNSGFSGLKAEDVAARVTAPFLIVHEDWDTLVSIEQSQRLVALAPDRFRPLWLLHEGPPERWDDALNSHGKLLESFASLGAYPIVWAHMLTHLAGPQQPIVVPWDRPSFRALLALMRARRDEGADLTFLAPQLNLLCDPRVSTFAVDDQAVAPGSETVAAELGAAWGVPLEPEATCRALAAGTLP